MDPISFVVRLSEEFKAACIALDRDEPWFGYVALRVGARLAEYKIGPLHGAGDGILPASHPIARAYYECEPGQRVVIDTEGLESIVGVVERKARVESCRRAVRSVAYADTVQQAEVRRTDHGFEVRHEHTRHPAGTNLLAWLSAEQHRVIVANPGQATIVLGRAGSGKTTVALCRAAWLASPSGRRNALVDPSRVLVVALTDTTAACLRNLSAGLPLQRATIDTFHAWALDRAKLACGAEIRVETLEHPGKRQAAAAKRHPGMLAAIDEFVATQRSRALCWLAERLAPYDGLAWVELLTQSREPLVRSLVTLRTASLAARDEATGLLRQRLEQIHRVVARAVQRATKYQEEVAQLLLDRALLERHLRQVPSNDIAALMQMQRELRGKHGPERHTGDWIGLDDVPLLMRLIQAKNGGLPGSHDTEPVELYDHVVVDDAQDFGAVELEVLMSAAVSRSAVTLAGDLNQKLLPEVDFAGWDGLARNLGGARIAAIDASHRGTFPLLRVADSLFGYPTAPGRPGPLPTLAILPSTDAQLVRAAALVREIQRAHPRAHICVATCRQRDVQPTHDLLADLLRNTAVAVGVAHSDKLLPHVGVTVTSMRQVKGVEFDAVVAMDATDDAYPDTEQGRRNLYTLLTRARDRLDILCPGTPSPLLRDAIDRGLVEVVGTSAVPLLEFTPAEDEPL